MEHTPLSLPKPPKRSGNILLPKVVQLRKLINQILTELRKRKKPPSCFQNFANQVDGSHEVFNADDTCDFLSQLRDVLVVCSMNGINFGDRLVFI